MKKFKKTIALFLIMVTFFIPIKINAEEANSQEDIKVYLFYSETCPHCKDEKEVLNELKDEYPIVVYEYEVSKSSENASLFQEVLSFFDQKHFGVPFTVIGDKTLLGYSGNYTKEALEDAFDYYLVNEYNNVVGDILEGVEPTNIIQHDIKTKEEDVPKKISLPIFGEVDTQKFSLPIITIMIGIIDGFNPCAMWVLLFLISMLIGMKDKKRMWVLGLTFIFVSALIYFIFMAAWLNLVILVGAVAGVKLLIGSLGLIGGGVNIRSYFKTKDDGCEVVPKNKRAKVFAKIKKFTHEKRFGFAILGIVALAISVNIIELFCSLGLPVIYTELLSLNNLSTSGYYGYLLLYTFFFMLDDIIIFALAMATLKLTGISTKYKKYSHLIGGILMILIGILLIFKPELLMFG